VLRFSPTAWAKLLFLRDSGDTEIGGFGVAHNDDLLFVEDVGLVEQTCTWAHVEFDDQSVADFFDDQVDAGRRPEQFGRIWVHTHPGDSPQPSQTDEATFERVFGRSDWAVMFILARGGQCYARLRYNVGPGVDVELQVDVDYSRPFGASDIDLWQAEYLTNVRVPPPEPPKKANTHPHLAVPSDDDRFVDDWWRDAWASYMDFDHYKEEAPYGYIRDF
jgi:proteasome lid subunit RPN8/RPN11